MPLAASVRRSCVSFLAGVGLGSFADTRVFIVACLGLGICVAFAAGVRTVRPRLQWAAILFCFIAGGAYILLLQYHILRSYPKQTARVITGSIILRELFPGEQRLTVLIREPQQLRGERVHVSAERYPVYAVGSVMQVGCDLRRLDVSKPAERRHLFLNKVGYSCRPPALPGRQAGGRQGRPEMVLVGEPEGIRFRLFQVSEAYSVRFNRFLHDPENSLLQAMVLNRTGEFPKHVREAFTRAGTAHIISISGLHMALLALVLDMILSACALGRHMRLGILTAMLSLYVLMVASPAPAVRSALMAIAFFGARTVGRPYSGMHTLLVVAALMVAVHPFALRYDIGFQLSFLALAGMALTGPLWERFFFFVPRKFLLRSTVAFTFAAQTLTWPLQAYYFQSFSLAAPLSNVLVVWMLAPTLILAFLIVPVSFATVFSPMVIWPLFFLVRIQIILTEYVSNVPISAVAVPFSAGALAMSYAILGGAIAVVARHKRGRQGLLENIPL